MCATYTQPWHTHIPYTYVPATQSSSTGCLFSVSCHSVWLRSGVGLRLRGMCLSRCWVAIKGHVPELHEYNQDHSGLSHLLKGLFYLQWCRILSIATAAQDALILAVSSAAATIAVRPLSVRPVKGALTSPLTPPAASVPRNPDSCPEKAVLSLGDFGLTFSASVRSQHSSSLRQAWRVAAVQQSRLAPALPCRATEPTQP